MGTHARVGFFEEDGTRELICCVHHHSDGYPAGVGIDLAEFLLNKRVGNGSRLDQQENFANGMGCLAAQYVAAFKKKPGQVYMVRVDNDWDEDYFYDVKWENVGEGGCFTITAFDFECDPFFSGPPQAFIDSFEGEV